jgi:hypothetical protein
VGDPHGCSFERCFKDIFGHGTAPTLKKGGTHAIGSGAFMVHSRNASSPEARNPESFRIRNIKQFGTTLLGGL